MLTGSITGWEEDAEGQAKGKEAVPSEKVAWLGSPGLCSKGFSITNLLGLETELQPLRHRHRC